MRYNLLEAFMGAIVLIIAALFLAFAYTSNKTNGSNGYHLMASFNRIDGLSLGSDVKLSGVKIGTITKISVNPKTYQALVTFSVNPDLRIPEDSSAEIASENFLGGKYLAIVPGGSDDYLHPNETIAHTQSSVSLEALISKFMFGGKENDKKTEHNHEKRALPAPETPSSKLDPLIKEARPEQVLSNGKIPSGQAPQYSLEN